MFVLCQHNILISVAEGSDVEDEVTAWYPTHPIQQAFCDHRILRKTFDPEGELKTFLNFSYNAS